MKNKNKENVYINATDKPIRFVSEVQADPLGGPGKETYYLVMPGECIDVTVLGLSKNWTTL